MAHLKRTKRHCTTLFLDKFAFRDQYGFLKDPRQEKADDFTSINAISSSDNEKTDIELDKMNVEISEMLRGLELRKRAYYVNMPNHVYVIGGYLFDPFRKERRPPGNDWRWDIDEKKLEKIPPIPGYGRINFGIAANNEDSLGSAVTLDEKDTLYVFGGYDLLSGNVQFRNDFLLLEDLTAKRWIKLKNTFNIEDKSQTVLPRARALLVACGDDVLPPGGGLFACGGYHKSPTGDLIPVPEILCYDKSTKDWIFLSSIPNLKKMNVFSVDNNVLVISDKVTTEEEDEELIPISKYDFTNRKWIMIDQKEIEEAPIVKTEPDQ
ncbi:unnamed protein product [Adineta ricciae]|uniref:Uncharacterized protein n=1 Tax=Adineta ricciae TaxID=249248 RepID=A0A815WBA3_ADIRI|nr:unnamed protein product [Adineta ricciae]